MRDRPPEPRPTHAELAILRVLWRRGPSTVREVHEELRRDNADDRRPPTDDQRPTTDVREPKDLSHGDEGHPGQAEGPTATDRRSSVVGRRSAVGGPGYTTVLKLLQIMTEKGLVTREEAGRAHVYRPRQSEEQAQKRLVVDLLDRAFGGSAQQLVLRALTARRASPEELAEIRRLLDELEGGAS